MDFERRRHNHAHLNIAPLVDVVFLLLLFFMLTSHLIQEPAIKLNLPESKTAEMEAESVKTIFLSKNGEIYYMDKRVDLENLRIVLSEIEPGRGFIRIKADREVSLGILVKVIDEVRLSGVNNFSLVTEKP